MLMLTVTITSGGIFIIGVSMLIGSIFSIAICACLVHGARTVGFNFCIFVIILKGSPPPLRFRMLKIKLKDKSFFDCTYQ